jgi:hypothetical protein
MKELIKEAINERILEHIWKRYVGTYFFHHYAVYKIVDVYYDGLYNMDCIEVSNKSPKGLKSVQDLKEEIYSYYGVLIGFDFLST